MALHTNLDVYFHTYIPSAVERCQISLNFNQPILTQTSQHYAIKQTQNNWQFCTSTNITPVCITGLGFYLLGKMTSPWQTSLFINILSGHLYSANMHKMSATIYHTRMICYLYTVKPTGISTNDHNGNATSTVYTTKLFRFKLVLPLHFFSCLCV